TIQSGEWRLCGLPAVVVYPRDYLHPVHQVSLAVVSQGVPPGLPGAARKLRSPSRRGGSGVSGTMTARGERCHNQIGLRLSVDDDQSAPAKLRASTRTRNYRLEVGLRGGLPGPADDLIERAGRWQKAVSAKAR